MGCVLKQYCNVLGFFFTFKLKFNNNIYFLKKIVSFAVPGKPETCPFQGRYSFSYTHNGRGPCSNPQSEIHACADESKFKFIYKACPGIPNTKERGNIHVFEKKKPKTSGGVRERVVLGDS